MTRFEFEAHAVDGAAFVGVEQDPVIADVERDGDLPSASRSGWVLPGS
jgi:hypothetical protein